MGASPPYVRYYIGRVGDQSARWRNTDLSAEGTEITAGRHGGDVADQDAKFFLVVVFAVIPVICVVKSFLRGRAGWGSVYSVKRAAAARARLRNFARALFIDVWSFGSASM